MHLSPKLLAVSAPPFAHGCLWANSRPRVSLQRRPSSPTKPQRPSSRGHTSRRAFTSRRRVRRAPLLAVLLTVPVADPTAAELASCPVVAAAFAVLGFAVRPVLRLWT